MTEDEVNFPIQILDWAAITLPEELVVSVKVKEEFIEPESAISEKHFLCKNSKKKVVASNEEVLTKTLVMEMCDSYGVILH